MLDDLYLLRIFFLTFMRKVRYEPYTNDLKHLKFLFDQDEIFPKAKVVEILHLWYQEYKHGYSRWRKRLEKGFGNSLHMFKDSCWRLFGLFDNLTIERDVDSNQNLKDELEVLSSKVFDKIKFVKESATIVHWDNRCHRLKLTIW